jgi:pimeloyl-ACP methyl ester carboxylesterase
MQKLKVKLSDHFTVYDLDFPGHGNHSLDVEETFSIALFATHLIDFLEENNCDKINVFGYSMGGYVAITAAAKSPHLFNHIVTYGTKFNWSPEIAAQEVKMLNPEKIEEKVPKFAQALEALHAPNDWKIVMHKTADLMLGLGDGSGLQTADFDLVKQSVTVGWGSADKMVSALESKNVADRLANGKFVSLENQPHPIEIVDVDVLVEYILNHIT